jgi:RIO kinase 1
MEFIGDEERPAPQLKDVRLSGEVAKKAMRWILYDIELMLANNVVHADLSPFNVLWWSERSWIIDFPQAVDPRFNRSAHMLLERDVANVCRYFERAGVPVSASSITAELWRRFMRAEL